MLDSKDHWSGRSEDVNVVGCNIDKELAGVARPAVERDQDLACYVLKLVW